MIDLILLERKIANANYEGKRFKSWWYQKKYKRLKRKVEREWTK